MLHVEGWSAVSFQPRLSPPQSRPVCAVFRRFALQLRQAISFQRLADLGEFYVKSKGFPCSTWKSSDFGRMDERGGLSSSCGAFLGPKISEWHRSEHRDRGFDRTEIRTPCCPRSGRCYMWKDGAPFHFNPVYRPRKAGRLCRLSRFALQLRHAISFQPLGRFG